MHFTALNIEDFGPFADRSFENLSPRLTVILGPNEAGKSAIRAFIRMVLFGVGDRRQRELFDFYNYPPVRGVSASGSISVQTASGKAYTIRRRDGPHGGPVTVTGDESGGNDLLALLIGSISEDVYQNVFSISLRELQQFETLNSGQVHDRIYSTGLGLGRVSLPDVLKGVSQELHRLWAPRSGIMRDRFNDTSTKMAELQSARSELGVYEELGRQEQDLVRKIEETQEALRNLRAGEERQKRLVELREPWDRQRELRRQIDPLQDPRAFPTDGTARFRDLERTRIDHDKAILDDNRREETLRRDIEALDVVDAFTRNEAAIERLLTEIAHYQSAAEDLPKLQGELTQIESGIGSSLQALGPLWNESKLSEPFDATSIEALLQTIGNRLDEARNLFQRTQDILNNANRGESETIKAVEDARRERDALQAVPNESVDALHAGQDRLQHLQGAVADHGSKEQELRVINLQLAAINGGARKAGMPKALWIVVLLITVGFLVALAGVTLGENTGIVAGALMTVGGLGIFFWFRSLNEEGSGLSDGLGSLDTLKGDREHLSRQSDEIQREIEALLSNLDVDEPSSDRALVEKLAAVGRAIRRREEYERLASAAEEAERVLESALAGSRTASTDVDAARTAVDQAATDWRALLVDVHLGPDREPNAALAALGLIRELRGQAQAADSLRERIKDISSSLSDTETRLRPVLDEAGLPAFQPHQALPALEDLQERFRRHLEAVERRQSLEKQGREWESERSELQKNLEEVTQQTGKLLSAAGCADAEAFLKMGQQVEKRRDLEIELDGLHRSRPLLVNEDGLSLRSELASVTAEEAQAGLREMSEEISRTEDERDQHLGDLRSLRDQRKQLEDSNPAQDLQFDIAELTERVKQDAHRWAVLTISRTLLEKTRDDFQRERQGPLLQAASGYFTRFTRGQYARVETVIGEERMRIVDSFERTKDARVALSRGTAEQLYLAMRFALIDEYSSNSERMPVLLDDVMVNFDPERARAACDGIVDVSARHQVLVLTCHPDTVEQLQAASADVEAPQPLVIEI